MSNERKHFWESHEEIDVAMYAEVLVAIFRYLDENIGLSLFRKCLEPERSDAVKTVALRACLTLVKEADRFPWQKPIARLQELAGPRIRDMWNVRLLAEKYLCDRVDYR
jgi:hypothetical protein